MALLLTYSLNYTRSRYITHPQTQAGNLSTTTQPYGRFESVNAQRKKYPSKFVFRWVFFLLNSPEIFILSPFRIDKNLVAKYFVIIPVVSFNFYVPGRSINIISYNEIYPTIESVVLGCFHCNGANSFEFFVIF